MKSTVTLKQIAEHADVSIGTVYRAIHNKGRISPETQRKILKIAKDLGYQPNVLASTLSTSKSRKILALVPEKPGYFFDIVYEGMKSAGQELEKFKFELEYIRPQRVNELSVNDLLASVNASNVDGVVLIPSPDMGGFINKLAAENVPVITYNCDIEDCKRLCYVGQNTHQAGKVAGELMGKFLNGNGTVIVLTGGRNVEAMESRKRGFTEELHSQFKNITIIDHLEYFEDEKRAESIVRSVLQSTPELGGIFATSLSGTVGTIRCMEKIDLQHRPVVIGFDAGKEVEEALKNNYITATLSQDPFLQGYYAVMFMSRVLMDGWQPERQHYHTTARILMRENIQDEDMLLSIKKPIGY